MWPASTLPPNWSAAARLAAKELRETIYWLRLIQKASMTTANLDILIQRTVALTAILVASRPNGSPQCSREVARRRLPVARRLFRFPVWIPK
jgi:hypothetical protein